MLKRTCLTPSCLPDYLFFLVVYRSCSHHPHWPLSLFEAELRQISSARLSHLSFFSKSSVEHPVLSVLSLASHSFLSEAAFLTVKFYIPLSIPTGCTPGLDCSHAPQLQLQLSLVTSFPNVGPSEPPCFAPPENLCFSLIMALVSPPHPRALSLTLGLLRPQKF